MTSTDETERTQVRRVRTSMWRSPRMGIGILLVAGSVALGAWTISNADEGVAMWVAQQDLSPGMALEDAALIAVSVRWEGEAGTYLPVSAGTPSGVVTSFVHAGELLPASAVGQAPEGDSRPMTFPVPPGSNVRAGGRVDVWGLAPTGTTQPEGPGLLAGNVLVTAVEENTALFASSGVVARVLIPADVVPSVLAVESDGGSITLVERVGG